VRFEPGGLRDQTEANHLNKCPVCVRGIARHGDLAQMLAHTHRRRQLATLNKKIKPETGRKEFLGRPLRPTKGK
jgi:hypothetical protein